MFYVWFFAGVLAFSRAADFTEQRVTLLRATTDFPAIVSDVVTIETLTAELGSSEVREKLFSALPDGLVYMNTECVVSSSGGSQFSIWVAFRDSELAARHKVAEVFRTYAELRLRGLSRPAAIDIVLGGDPDTPNGKQEQTKLRKSIQWLPFRLLRKVQPGDIKTVWWIGQSGDYVFVDEDYTFVVRILEDRVDVFALDSTEFRGGNAVSIGETAVQLADEVEKDEAGNPKSAIAFWRNLRNRLERKNIKWKSPEDLNQGRTWR